MQTRSGFCGTPQCSRAQIHIARASFRRLAIRSFVEQTRLYSPARHRCRKSASPSSLLRTSRCLEFGNVRARRQSSETDQRSEAAFRSCRCQEDQKLGLSLLRICMIRGMHSMGDAMLRVPQIQSARAHKRGNAHELRQDQTRLLPVVTKISCANVRCRHFRCRNSHVILCLCLLLDGSTAVKRLKLATEAQHRVR